MKNQWMITNDHIADPGIPEGTNLNAKGLQGPGKPMTFLEFSAHPNAKKFRMYDDDDELYYEGICLNDDSSDELGEGMFAPLDDFGMCNAGCTRIDYFINGKWETL